MSGTEITEIETVAGEQPIEQKESLKISENAGGYSEVWYLAYPIIITSLSRSIMGVVDTIFMGKVGIAEQGAVGLGGIFVWTVASIFTGTLTVNNTFVAQRFGAKKYKECAKTTWQGLWLCIPFAIILLFLVQPFLKDFFELAGTKPEITDHAYIYGHVRLYGVFFMFIEFTLVAFFRGIGDTKTPMKVVIIANLLNIVLDYWLIFGGLGIKPLGTFGAGLATALSSFCSALVFLYLYIFTKKAKQYGTQKEWRFSFKTTKNFLKIGFPIGVSWIFHMGTWSIFTIIISRIGKIELAANNIVMQLLHLSFMPGVAMSITTTTLVGQYLGAEREDLAFKSANTSLKFGLAYMSLMALIFFTFKTELISLFNSDVDVIKTGARLLIFAAAFQCFDALGMISGGALKGGGDTRWPMILEFIAGWFFFVPITYFFSIVMDSGVYGAWFGAMFYIIILGVMMFGRYVGGKWKKMRV